MKEETRKKKMENFKTKKIREKNQYINERRKMQEGKNQVKKIKEEREEKNEYIH